MSQLLLLNMAGNGDQHHVPVDRRDPHEYDDFNSSEDEENIARKLNKAQKLEYQRYKKQY